MLLRLAGHTLVGTELETSDQLLVRARRERDGKVVLVKTHAAGRPDSTLLQRYRQAPGRALSINARYVAKCELVESAERTALTYRADLELLASYLRARGKTSLDGLFRIAIATAEALQAVHDAGWVHGDVRPSTILVDADTARTSFLDLMWASRNGEPEREAEVASGMAPYSAPEQTGRIGLRPDRRADLYSLGAVCFELACGRPPFVAEDPLQLVHAHLASVPVSVCELRDDVPRALGDIIAKLLAKSPDDRYQSCRGLLADLHQAASDAQRGEHARTFPLGREDARATFELPRKLYGRDRERAQLLECFVHAAEGRGSLFIAAGPPGVGKSSLIRDLEPSVVEAGGLFLAGKFDQLLLSAPYSAIKQAFGDLFQRLLGESDAEIARWRSTLLAAVGTQGRILTDLIPNLAHIIGPQLAVEALGPIESQQRLVLVFRRLLGALARPEHPLVLFLDDWQWADAASAGLIQDAMAAAAGDAVLLVLAYRDTELAPASRAHGAIAHLRGANIPTMMLSLAPLEPADIEAFVAEALGCPPDHARALAQVIAARTGGNPFFVRSFLQVLHETGKLQRTADGWRANVDELAAAETGDIVELVATRISRLPEGARELLAIAACLGAVVRDADLRIAADLEEPGSSPELLAAVEAGLIARTSSELRFVHDRIQEAAYTSIPPAARAAKHLEVGRRLVGASPGEPSGLAIEQLNAGRTLITSDRERLELAHHNLRAGERAREATAYASAARHAAIGIELLAGGAWDQTYELALALHVLHAESAYLSGQFATAEQLYDVALRHARTDLDRIRILTIKKDHYELQGRYLDAIEVLREGLVMLGVAIPDSDEDLGRMLVDELAQVPVNLGGRTIASLVDAPEITDPRLIATLQLLMGLWPSCYVAGRQALLRVVSLKIANFCLVHGNCEVTSAAYVNYSFVAGFVTGDYATAYEFGELGIALSERYRNRAVRAWCYFLFGCGTAVWRRPLRECTPYLERSFELGLESGSLASACYACSYVVTDAFFQGRSLHEVDALYAHYREVLARHNPAILVYLELGIRSMRRLVGRDTLDESALAEILQQSAFFQATHAFGQLSAAYHLDDLERAVACADAAMRPVSVLLAGIYKVPEASLHAALAWLAASERATGDEQRRLRDAAAAELARLQQLAAHCAENIAHKVLLVEGELARVEGRFEEAASLFERAADDARRTGFQQAVALANELAAKLWRDRGLMRAASAYMQAAYDQYQAWGAHAKLDVLRARYPDLIETGAEPRERAPTAAATLDLITVTKASQAISREIELDALLSRLMLVMIETAGARRGAIAVVDNDTIRLLASATGAEVAVGAAVEPSELVVDSIVRYVVRTGDAILLDDAASEGRFVRDPQVRRRGSRSIACLPLRVKDRVIGALYLENELNAATFTAGRRVVLELLASQAAISLENARLYSDLKTANQAKDEFLAILGHELRNPLAPVMTAVHLMKLQGSNHFMRERDVIERQANHMVRLVDDLLDVSRIARGKIELVRKPTEVASVIRDAIELVSPLSEKRGIRVEVLSLPGDLTIHGDGTRITQVVSNLLTNAIKFSDPGRPVTVEVSREGHDVRICVRDEGAGIAPDLLPNIFDLFVQAPQTRDRRLGGLGLGLAIAKNLVTLHGGTITARSPGPGRGSEFEIRLPFHGGAVQPAAGGVTAPDRVARPRRILVVDDNVDAAALLTSALEAMGHATLVVHDGPAALASLDGFSPDVAVLDIGLPVMDGFEVARRIRAHFGAASPRLIAMSGYQPPVDAAVARVFDEYFVKPVNPERLARSLG